MVRAALAAMAIAALLGLALAPSMAATYPQVTSSFDSLSSTFTYRVTMLDTTTMYFGALKVNTHLPVGAFGLDITHPENYMTGAWVLDSNGSRISSLDWQTLIWDNGGNVTLHWLPKQGQSPIAPKANWVGEFDFKLPGVKAAMVSQSAQPLGGPGSYPLYDAWAPVPEPSSLAALGSLAGLFFVIRRKR